ncbi:Gfo/Idh/MocA family oxidoreductase [bacterium]|nr:Gfo/Idh/MocA family oxidoreductase [bacterium]
MLRGKYLVGIVGFGGIARMVHFPGWKKLKDVEVFAIADVSKEARNYASEKLEISHVYDDYKKLLEMEEIDIIDICAPNRFHYQITVDALNAGKHVICEKPLALSIEEVKGMIEASKKNRKKLMAGQHLRFTKEAKVIKELIEDGVFGEIYHAIAFALRRRYLPPSPTFIKKELSGGGPMFDIGVHILDLTYWFMGCPEVHSVNGATYTKLAKRKDIRGLWGEWDRDAYDVEDFATGFIRFKNNATILLTCSFLANMEKLSDLSTTLFGTEAGIRWPDGKLATEKKGVLQNIDLKMETLPDVEPHHEEIRIFLECVKEDKEVPVKPEESLEVIKMLEGIYKSSETGKEVIF